MTQPTTHSPGIEPPANNLAALVQSFADWLDRRRLRLCCAVLLALELAIFLVLIAGTHGWIVPLEHATTTDFASFYAAGALANAGTPQLAYDQAAHYAMEQAVTAPGIEYQFFNYPPVYLILCAALAHLPYLVAFVLFIAATLAFYVAVARHILDDRSITALLVLAAFPMVFWTIGLGQNAFLTAALFGMATLWIDRRQVAAGLLLGLLCYKPHFGLLLPIALAAGGYWRSFAAAAASAGSLVLVSLLLFGWETWHAFFVTAGNSHAVYESGRILFAGFANPFGAVRLQGTRRLDQDYLGRPFEPMPQLLAIAEYITKTLAICVVCGEPANHTQRLVASGDRVLVGATGLYEARCRHCFDPGLASREA